jgi:hypothetical protein
MPVYCHLQIHLQFKKLWRLNSSLFIKNGSYFNSHNVGYCFVFGQAQPYLFFFCLCYVWASSLGVLSHGSCVSSSVLSSTSNKLVLFLQGVSVLVFPGMESLSHRNNAYGSTSREICLVHGNKKMKQSVHLIKNQLMHLLRKHIYIHIKTQKLVKNVL